jgi:trans-aconitate methyltransferase
VRRSFDHLARPYAWLERLVFADALERTRFAHLEHLANRARVLVLGEGDGRCLERMLRVAPSAVFDVVDDSPAMLAQARSRSVGDERVRFHEVDARRFTCTEPYDLVVTHFFLDCFEGPDLAELVSRVSGVLQSGGLWIYGDFRPEAREPSTRLLVWALYRAFRLVTDIQSRALADPRPALLRAGLVRIDRRCFGNDRLVSEVWRKA